MQAHDFSGRDPICRECRRPPGNYIHAGMDDDSYDRAGFRDRDPLARDLTVNAGPPLALLSPATESAPR